MIEEDEVIEDRILMDIVVDAYDKEERAMGWFYYIAEGLEFPFQAKCIDKKSISKTKTRAHILMKVQSYHQRDIYQAKSNHAIRWSKQ